MMGFSFYHKSAMFQNKRMVQVFAKTRLVQFSYNSMFTSTLGLETEIETG